MAPVKAWWSIFKRKCSLWLGLWFLQRLFNQVFKTSLVFQIIQLVQLLSSL